MATQAIGRPSVWRSIGELVPSLVIALVGVQASVSLLLVQRRLAGALMDPGGGALLAAGLLAVALAAAPRTIARATCRPLRSPLYFGAVWWMPALALLLALLALSVRGSAWWAVGVIWAAAIAEEAWCWAPLTRGGAIQGPFVLGSLPRNGFPRPSPLRWRRRADEPRLRRDKSNSRHEPTEKVAVQRAAAEQPVADVWQQTSRAYEADGADALRGTLRAFLAVGQRTAHVHLAFCPPFVRLPQLDYRQTAGPAARVKLGQLLPYGVRLDVKLDEAAGAPATVLLELTARS
jgi:hypothetical protein